LTDLRPPQLQVYDCEARFRVLVAGRRFGKTHLALAELCRGAWGEGTLAWYVAPSYRQAKQIAWKRLKEMTREWWEARPNESELRIEMTTGGTICLRGADNYDSLRGNGLDFLVLDEYASIAPEVWPEVLRPALADKLGRALFIGTPKGHDHFHDLYEAAAENPDWTRFQFTTEEGLNVRPEEVVAAARELDQKTYLQEFCARFENLTAGRVYHAFDREGNVGTVRYDASLPVLWSLDFNVNPMCSVIAQKDGERLWVLEEMALADSHTLAACEEFARRLAKWGRELTVRVYGDASGNGRNTAASRTDWQIVREFLAGRGYQASLWVPDANPAVRDRVNCVNGMLRNQAGERRLVVDAGCRELIRDLERVSWGKDGVDKSDPMRSHLSDALGYVVAREFGMKLPGGFMPGRLV
jgi:hypothetical protein